MGRHKIRRLTPADMVVIMWWPKSKEMGEHVKDTWLVRTHRRFADEDYHHVTVSVGLKTVVDDDIDEKTSHVFFTLEYAYGRILTDLWADTVENLVKDSGATAARAISMEDPFSVPGTMTWGNCVSMAKSIIGCQARSVLTPRQLLTWVDIHTDHKKLAV